MLPKVLIAAVVLIALFLFVGSFFRQWLKKRPLHNLNFLDAQFRVAGSRDAIPTLEKWGKEGKQNFLIFNLRSG